MNARIDCSADNRKDGHRFRRTVNTRTPVLPEQKQNRGNECPRVANTDPKHEVDNRPSPENWVHITPDTNTGEDEIANQRQKHHRRYRRETKKHIPQHRLRIFGNSANHFGNRTVRLIPRNQLRTPTWNVFCVIDFSGIQCGSTSYGGHGHLILGNGHGHGNARDLDALDEFGSMLPNAEARFLSATDTTFLA